NTFTQRRNNPASNEDKFCTHANPRISGIKRNITPKKMAMGISSRRGEIVPKHALAIQLKLANGRLKNVRYFIYVF
ncbi:MAG: hypothetical protein ACPGVW_05115, partial [Pseudoalteromonas marina]